MLFVPDNSHAVYQDFLISQFLEFFPDPFVISKKRWDTILQFYELNLSQTNEILIDVYSSRGPLARVPSDMLRSYLLSIKLGISSITKWVELLKDCPLYAIISGFSPGNVPGIGTFYDFFNRIWLSDSNNFTGQFRHKKKKTPKGKKTGDKTPNITKTAAYRFIEFYKSHPLPDYSGSPLNFIFRLYNSQFLDTSVKKGLINSASLSLSGDGTPVRTSARTRYKKVCKCKEKRCDCKRKYSQPDCNIGWDSSRDCYFNGYHLYMFVASDSDNDLPIFPILERGSRHDMLSFLHSFFTMKSWLPEYKTAKLLLDSAHDADAVYRFCNELDIRHLIDLNNGNTGNRVYKDTFTLDDAGIPVCQKGLKMHSHGIDYKRKRHKYRCPIADNGDVCDTPCSNSSYGRVVYTRIADDPRIFTIPARGSKQWAKEYNARTSVERSNKREKEDYKLEDGKHRSSKMWYCRLYGIMMLQHLDAWENSSVEEFQDMIIKQSA
jgi:hypothetical protein